MNYSFEVNVDDNKYYEFNKYTMLYPHGKKEKFLRTKLLLPAVFLLAWVINLISGKDWEYLTISILVYAVASVIWMFIVTPYNLFALKMNMRFFRKKGKLPYSEHSRIQFLDDCYIDESETVKEETKYDAITCICENKGKAIYLYQGLLRANIIPYSAFESDEQKEAFLEFISKKTGKSVITQKL